MASSFGKKMQGWIRLVLIAEGGDSAFAHVGFRQVSGYFLRPGILAAAYDRQRVIEGRKIQKDGSWMVFGLVFLSDVSWLWVLAAVQVGFR